jgi:hypothetical protein
VRDGDRGRRRPAEGGPTAEASGWLTLDDDELLHRIESLSPGHAHDADLLEVVRSGRHFFVRQEAAKKIRSADRLRSFSSDRHVGQILVRHITRSEDESYLEMLARRSRHIEVRNAAEAQLRLLRERRAGGRPQPAGEVTPD